MNSCTVDLSAPSGSRKHTGEACFYLLSNIFYCVIFFFHLLLYEIRNVEKVMSIDNIFIKSTLVADLSTWLCKLFLCCLTLQNNFMYNISLPYVYIMETKGERELFLLINHVKRLQFFLYVFFFLFSIYQDGTKQNVTELRNVARMNSMK